MNTMKKAAAGAVIGGAMLAAGGFGLAHAAPPAQSVVGDGKVNVTVSAGGKEIGVLQDVSLANAEALAASTCANAAITSDALRALDTNGTPLPNGGECAGVDGGVSFRFAQNGPGNSENAPGQNRTAPSSSSTPSAAPAR